MIPSSEPPPQAKEVLPQHRGGFDAGTRLPQQLVEDSNGEDITEGITVAISTATEPNLKQNGACLLNTKEQPADVSVPCLLVKSLLPSLKVIRLWPVVNLQKFPLVRLSQKHYP